jgi:glycosyltransferase involved in cell wall biosynthesis
MNGEALFIAGAFPPPVHGMAAVNAAVLERLLEAGANPVVIDVAASSLDRSLRARLGRLPKIVLGVNMLLLSRGLRHGTLYISVSGGFGQIYEIFFVLVARLRGMRVYLHHHSFAYLDRTNPLTRVLVAVAGSVGVHVTLSPKMAARLRVKYAGVRRVIPISNAVFFGNNRSPSSPVRLALKSIGFISNIAEQKGIFEFLELVAACEAEGLHLRAKLAGPFQDSETDRKVRQRLGRLRTLEYLGPQYGDDKEWFFGSIDALMFPTRYVNEAEPLAIHDAMHRALPVIAYGRGCIPELVGPDGGLVIDPAAPFVPAALAQIEAWLSDPAAFEAASKAAAQRFANTYAENSERWAGLLTEIAGPANSDLGEG